MENSKEVSQKTKYRITIWSSISLLGTYPDKTVIQKRTYTPMFPAALHTRAKTWKQPKVQREVNGQRWHNAYLMEYHPATKKRMKQCTSVDGPRDYHGLPRWLSGKESACNAGDPGLIPGLRRSPGERTGYLLQDSCLGKPMDREAQWATGHGTAKELDMTQWLRNNKETIILSGISQTEKDKYHTLSLICGSQVSSVTSCVWLFTIQWTAAC